MISGNGHYRFVVDGSGDAAGIQELHYSMLPGSRNLIIPCCRNPRTSLFHAAGTPETSLFHAAGAQEHHHSMLPGPPEHHYSMMLPGPRHLIVPRCRDPGTSLFHAAGTQGPEHIMIITIPRNRVTGSIEPQNPHRSLVDLMGLASGGG